MSLPYFALYPTDFDGKTAHLTLAEDGAYNRLLRLQWSAPGCKLPSDMPWIMRKIRAVSVDDKAVVQSVVAEFFTRKGGKVFNERLLKEWVKSSAANERRILAGSKGGTAKALKEKKFVASNATAMPYQPEPEPEPDSKKVEAKASRGNVDLDACFDHFNATAERAGWSMVQARSPARRAALAQRVKMVGGVDQWCEAINRAAMSPLLTGQSGSGWRADFDWLAKSANFTKLMEGNYDERRTTGTNNGGGRSSPHNALLAGFAMAAHNLKD